MTFHDAAVLVGIAVALGASLLILVPVPWGGTVPLGLAFGIALPAHLSVAELAVVSGAASALVGVASLLDDGWRGAAGKAGRVTLALAATTAGSAAVVLLMQTAPPAALTVAVAGAGVLTAELAWRAASGRDAPVDLRAALPIYLSFAFAGGMLALAIDEVGVAMSTVVAFPLLIGRFAFQRHAEATETLRQTVQALGLVPELAGIAPLGHSERAAWYAAAIARDLGFDEPTVDRIVTATRLHHLGALCDESDTTPGAADVAAAGASVLREAGFPADVTQLIEDACVDGDVEATTPAAAAVRVAAAFDHVVGDDPSATNRGVALIGTMFVDRHSRFAASALLACVARDARLVPDAIAAGARFCTTAQGLEIEELVAASRGAELLPFARRR